MSQQTEMFCENTAADEANHLYNAAKPSKPKILVVEDNLLNQKVARIFLEDMGYGVDIAANGQQALDKFSTEYAAILMDIGLPDMDGCNVCIAIRQLDHGKQVPIIALTASGEYFKSKCLAVGMNFYLTKPIIIDELKQLLSSFIPSA